MKENVSRKNFLKQSLGYAGLILGGAFFAGSCNSNNDAQTQDSAKMGGETPESMVQPENCNDLTGLSAEEIKKRKDLGYVETAATPDVRCDVCKLHLPPREGEKCGGCSLFKGFVDPGASCTYFAPLET